MGKVYLIGAGPGAPDLITVRGARLLAMADVVLHDALVEPDMLHLAPAHAKRIAVGKRCGQLSTTQACIDAQLVAAAREHDVVVRLKGGDPMLFGRADEEMRALETAGIEYEVVPGITAALASAATLHRPLTLRGVARSVALATFSHATEFAQAGYHVKADSLVLYMGRDSAHEIAHRLIETGRDGATPVAIVEACSTPRERSLTLTLAELAAGDARKWLDPAQPCVLMIGEAFGLRR
ncbi:uroporphyrinogen-III C-methyltransferase [Paraburkholderia sp. J12]|uniref:uroporphyrinogen-III C-methyltransferase n=1 Tax=Paraburkholderia sp. J12 TaxID=2805432 RepID=UPI002ABE52B4|nr:uroporphyrinogen-III C-methyltransferase [Paraburkholderia sp. J12]